MASPPARSPAARKKWSNVLVNRPQLVMQKVSTVTHSVLVITVRSTFSCVQSHQIPMRINSITSKAANSPNASGTSRASPCVKVCVKVLRIVVRIPGSISMPSCEDDPEQHGPQDPEPNTAIHKAENREQDAPLRALHPASDLSMHDAS